MKLSDSRWIVVPSILMLALSGCATTRAHKPDPAMDQSRQIVDMQNQLVAKDQEIQDLRYQLDSSRQALPTTNISIGGNDRFNILRVSGVGASELQRALSRAGYDPGPIDGKLGTKTRSAVKAFQRAHGLKADGVVGERTWSALRNA